MSSASLLHVRGTIKPSCIPQKSWMAVPTFPLPPCFLVLPFSLEEVLGSWAYPQQNSQVHVCSRVSTNASWRSSLVCCVSERSGIVCGVHHHLVSGPSSLISRTSVSSFGRVSGLLLQSTSSSTSNCNSSCNSNNHQFITTTSFLHF